MNSQEIIVIALLFLSTISGIALAFYTWRRRSQMGLWAFGVISVGLAWWSFWYAAEIALPGLITKLWMARMQYVGIVWVPYGWFTFALAYTERGKWLIKKWLILFALIPIITILASFTNDYHHLFYTEVALNNNGALSVLDASYGVVWYLYFVYAYILLFVGTVLLFIRIFTIPKAYLFQQILLILSPVLPWIANLLYVLRISPIPQLDLSPLAFTLSLLILGADIFRFHLFDISPMARSTVVDNMETIMIVVDNNDRIVDFNPSVYELFEEKGGQLLGKTFDELFLPFPALLSKLREQKEFSDEFSINQNDTERHYRVQANRIYDRSERVSGRLLLLTDVTRTRVTEEALVLAKVRTNFLKKVSHELRMPLNDIASTTQLLKNGVYGILTDRQEKVIGQVIERVEHLNHLLKDLLEYAPQEIGDFILANEPFSPAKLLESIREIFSNPAKRKNLVLYTAIEPDLPLIMLGDSTRLLQILINLTENAIKFTEKGHVEINLKKTSPKDWAIQISDTGIGISADRQQRLLGADLPSMPGEEPTSDGAGVGLSIVKQLVKRMEGKIEITKSSDQGTTFLVTLPLLEPSANENNPPVESKLMF